MSIESIDLWHKRARPDPTPEEFSIQLGCHFEEVAELFETLAFDFESAGMAHEVLVALTNLSERLKKNGGVAKVHDRKEFLDAIADQIVTGIGAAHCAKMDGAEAVRRVNLSNWSKYDEHGQPSFDEHGKIMKGHNYAPPNLEGLY